MEHRRFGRTGHLSSLAVLGAVAFWYSDQAQADAALNLALEHGVNHIDVAPQYGNAQQVVGTWLESRRGQFFLNCKTLERTRYAAWADLQNSLALLHTDVIDLYQAHGIATCEDLDRLRAPGGAIEAFYQARDQGMVRYLGITAHGMMAPAVCQAALELLDLDSVMLPLNARLYADPDYRRDAERLLQLCQQRDVGVMVIKAIAKGPWPVKTEPRPTPWYEPYHDYANIEKNLRFALSQPVTAACTVGNLTELPLFLRAAASFTPMDEAGQTALIAQRAAEEDEPIFIGPRFNTPE